MKLSFVFALIFSTLWCISSQVEAQFAPQFKRGDIDQSGTVNNADLTTMGSALSRFIRGDVNQSGLVDLSDLILTGKALPQFKRGDANHDGSVDGSDATYILLFLYQGGETPQCMDAADADDVGEVDQSDAIYILYWVNLGGPAPPAPGPFNCGFDPTSDTVGCSNPTACPQTTLVCQDAGDVNDNGVFNLNDYYYLYNFLFRGGPWPRPPYPNCGTDPSPDGLTCTGGTACYIPLCWDAADANDDGVFSELDYAYLSSFLYSGGPAPPAPGPFICGQDPTADFLDCQNPICP